MKKRIFSLCLILVMLSVLTGAAYAAEMQPMASVNVDGGLVYNGGNSHTLWASATGGGEYKTATAKLYISDGGWTQINSVTKSGYSTTVLAQKDVTLSSGYYKVECTATTATGTSYRTRYYTI